MKKTSSINNSEPMNIAIRQYYERDAVDLASHELKIYEPLHCMGIIATKGFFNELFVEDDGLKRLSELKHAPAIVAPVHRSLLDIPVVGIAMKEADAPLPRYLAKAELAARRPTRWLLGHLGAIPLDRFHFDKKARNTVGSLVAHTIAEGRSIVIFPEGTRDKGLHIRNVEDGVALYALKNEVPILPVGIAGTEGAVARMIKGRRPKVALKIGRPIYPRRRFSLTSAELKEELQHCFDGANHLLENRS